MYISGKQDTYVSRLHELPSTTGDLNNFNEYQNNTKKIFRNFKFDENRPIIHDNDFKSSSLLLIIGSKE